jgi:hypothetical protein
VLSVEGGFIPMMLPIVLMMNDDASQFATGLMDDIWLSVINEILLVKPHS